MPASPPPVARRGGAPPSAERGDTAARASARSTLSASRPLPKGRGRGARSSRARSVPPCRAWQRSAGRRSRAAGPAHASPGFDRPRAAVSTLPISRMTRYRVRPVDELRRDTRQRQHALNRLPRTISSEWCTCSNSAQAARRFADKDNRGPAQARRPARQQAGPDQDRPGRRPPRPSGMPRRRLAV